MRKTFKEVGAWIAGGSAGVIASWNSILPSTLAENSLIDSALKLFMTLGVTFLSGLASALATQLAKKIVFKKKVKDSSDDDEESKND